MIINQSDISEAPGFTILLSRLLTFGQCKFKLLEGLFHVPSRRSLGEEFLTLVVKRLSIPGGLSPCNGYGVEHQEKHQEYWFGKMGTHCTVL